MSFSHDPTIITSCLSMARAMLYPSYLILNWLLCLYVTTAKEDQQPYKVLARKILLTPVHLMLLILCLPLVIIFLPIRCLLIYIRQPFMYSEVHTQYTHRQTEVMNESINGGDYEFGVASANLCLMAEFLSKYNQISNVDSRAKEIGERIAVSQFYNDKWTKIESKWKQSTNENDRTVLKRHEKEDSVFMNTLTTNTRGREEKEVIGDVTTSFPHLDVLTIQEVWSSYHNKALIHELHKVFPYIIHDVGTHSFQLNRFFLGSGLLVASKHPVVAIDFKPFLNSILHCRFLSMGLLMIKVTIGKATTRGQNVGYIFNTHFQSYQGREKVIPKQMSDVLAWAKQFMRDNEKSGDNVLFSFLCGDFNSDNLSPVDIESRGHELFNEFEDICRVSPGCDKPWTVGTELRQLRMSDSLVTSPEGLKTVLEDPALRQCYLIDADIVEQTREALVLSSIKMDEHGNVKIIPEGGKRRVDYVTYRKSCPVNVTGFHAVTQLASLTDHIPLAMTFTCPRLRQDRRMNETCSGEKKKIKMMERGRTTD